MSPKEPNAVDVLVGGNIRIQRHAGRISQSAPAERLGVTFQQVPKYEGGVNRLAPDGSRASPPRWACRSRRCSAASRACATSARLRARRLP